MNSVTDIQTIDSLLRAAASAYADRPAFIDNTGVIDFRELDSLTARFAEWVGDREASPGDRLGIYLPRSVAANIAYLGCMRAGITVFPVSTALIRSVPGPMKDLLRPALLIADDSLLTPELHSVAGDCGVPVVSRSEMDSGLRGVAGQVETPTNPDVDVDGIVYLNVTSGTTGSARFAATSHRNLVVNTLSVHEYFRPEPDDVYMCLFPIDLHPHEHFMRSLVSGCATVLTESRNPRIILDAMREWKVSWLKAAPVALDLLDSFCRRRRADRMPCGILEISGVTSTDQLARWRETFEGSMDRVWGSTETTGIALASGPDGAEECDLMGRAMPRYEVAVLDENDLALPHGETGRMMLKSDAVFQGYLENSNGVLSTRESDWHDTGDLAAVDSNGDIHFRGRRRDIIKAAGRKFYTGMLEGLLRQVDDVNDAAVVKVSDASREDVAVAFVVIREDSDVSVEDLRRGSTRVLPPGINPAIFILKRFPLTPAGKTDYPELTEEAVRRTARG